LLSFCHIIYDLNLPNILLTSVKQAEMDAKKKTGAELQDSVVDELFGALKGGNVFKNRRVQGGAPQPGAAIMQAATSQQPMFPVLRPTSGAKKP
jgi:hypothetical protein